MKRKDITSTWVHKDFHTFLKVEAAKRDMHIKELTRLLAQRGKITKRNERDLRFEFNF